MDFAYVQTAEVHPKHVLRLAFENGIQVGVDSGNGELDIAPETLYARATGVHEPHGSTKR